MSGTGFVPTVNSVRYDFVRSLSMAGFCRTRSLSGRRRSARRETAPSSYSSAPAATTDACGRHVPGALMRLWYSALRGSHGRKSPRGIAGRAFRLRRAAARSATRLPPSLLARQSTPRTDLTPDWKSLPGRLQVRPPTPSAHGQPRPPAARVSFAATSDSRDTRRGKARP